MGKQGPCYHCGAKSTPLWRNGPPEKPVLCNACGSRWRTKGTLANYTPLHARAESDDFEGYKVPKVRTIPVHTKEAKLHKRKQTHENVRAKEEAPDYDHYLKRGLEEDISNRSSSGSAISYSESCTQFGGADASSAQSVAWDTLVPSRKRTCFNRLQPSPIQKLTEDLCSILHEQQNSYFSGSSEEDLIFENSTPMVSVEIGHGSVLIKHPNSAAREEESEASSLSMDKKTNAVNEAHSGSASLSVHIDGKGVSFPSVRIDNMKKPLGQVTQEHTKRDKSQHEKLKILQNPNSPLRSINLKDVVNFEEFLRHLTHEEQQLLMKYLPPMDTAKLQDSLKNMFDSRQFVENLSSFQKLLGEGVFDLSFSGVNSEECKTLKRLALVNLKNFNWVEHYNLLKDVKRKQITGGKGVATGHGSSNLVPEKRHRDGQNHNFPGPKATMKIPKRVVMKASYDTKDVIDNDGSCFSPRSLFAAPPDGNSLMLDCFQFTENSSDQDLLLDVPSNGSFPQAELLHPLSSFGSRQASTSGSVVYPRIDHP